MDYCVQLSFDNSAPELNGYSVDHVAVAEPLGVQGLRVFEPSQIAPALRKAETMIEEFKVPVIVEIILERVTNISMGTEINAVNEFEPGLVGNDAPTAPFPCSIKENPMPRFAANLSMLFTEQDFLARFKAAAEAGFSGVEYLFRVQLSRHQGAAGCPWPDPSAVVQPAGR